MILVIHFDTRKAKDEFMAIPSPEGISYQINFSASDDTLLLVLELARDIGVGIVSTWLYDKLKSKPIKIIYRRKEIQCEKGEIKRIIEENIKIG